MRFRYTTKQEKLQKIKQWHKHFCLFPICQDGVCYWLEYMEKRFISDETDTDWYQLEYGYYEYRGIEK